MPIAELRADNEAVFRSAAVKEWCAASGIRLSHCAPYTPAEQFATIEHLEDSERGGLM
jgi:transposase InsO family protein